MTTPLVNASEHDGVMVLELSNPPANNVQLRNTYSYEMMRQPDVHILDARFDAAVHVLLITGKGDKFFCAGADIGHARKGRVVLQVQQGAVTKTDIEVAIWNRATRIDSDHALRQGDRHLAALLLMHGMAMNGGVFHAVEATSGQELKAGCTAFRFFGLGKAADALEEASEILARSEDDDESERRLDLAYWEHASDESIFQQFRASRSKTPDLYAPVQVGA